jgi:hypothetical protein
MESLTIPIMKYANMRADKAHPRPLWEAFGYRSGVLELYAKPKIVPMP